MQFRYFETALRAQKSYNRLMEPVCRKWDMTHNELDVLLFLANNPTQNRAVDIVRGRGMSKGHVSLSLGSLASRGLVARREDGADRRTVHLVLTDAAEEITKDGRAAQREFIDRIREGITPEENAAMQSVTRKLEENIRRMERELQQTSRRTAGQEEQL